MLRITHTKAYMYTHTHIYIYIYIYICEAYIHYITAMCISSLPKSDKFSVYRNG